MGLFSPGVPNIFGDLTGACTPRVDGESGSAFSLTNFTELIDAASNDELSAFIAALQAKTGIAPMNVTQIRGAIEQATDSDKNGLAADLGVPSVFYVEGLSEVIQAGTTEQITDAACKLVEKADTVLLPAVTIARAAAGVASSAKWLNPTACSWVLALELGDDLLSNDGGKVEQLFISECSGLQAIDSAVTTGKNALGAEVTDKLWRQYVANALSALLRCCNPCEEKFATADIGTFAGSGEHVAGCCISEVVFTFDVPEFARETQYSSPDLVKYGKLRWIYTDDTYGELQFMNSSPQSFVPPLDRKVKGFNWTVFPGISGGWTYRFRDPYGAVTNP